MTKEKAPDHTAIDSDGHVLPYTPEEVKAIVARALNEGNILAVLIEMKDGSLAVQVMGPPSMAIAHALETAATSYRRVLKGH